MKRNVLRDRKGRQKTEQNGRKKETTQERRVAAIWKNFLGVVLLGRALKKVACACSVYGLGVRASLA